MDEVDVLFMTMPPNTLKKRIHHPILRVVVLSIGWLSTVLGVLGIFLPVLPTTPFLLLAAACFIRTSPKFYTWLVAHPKLGRYVMYYLDGQGIPKRAKIYTLLMLWGTLLLTVFVLSDSQIVRWVLPVVGSLVSLYILKLPTLTISKS